jgi:hypothetical protein
MNGVGSLKIGEEEYVVIPRSEYLRLQEALPAGSVDAVEYAVASIAKDLRAMRAAAALSQLELAKKLKVSQSMVANAEAGRARVGESYIPAGDEGLQAPQGLDGPCEVGPTSPLPDATT